MNTMKSTTGTTSSTPLTTKANTSTSRQSAVGKSNVEVPIFLRKTYHMIDTCDPTIASWSEDGETFVVKQPQIFSSKIIPQFFKHSKFSSFVRQLNFYGFRKIKYSDSIKINEELEKETKDYWRFRHECFRKAREDLLTGIKRSNGNQHTDKKKVTGTPASSGVNGGKKEAESSKQDVSELKKELGALKDRIAKMTSNIDTLTNMVQSVSIEEKKENMVKVEEQQQLRPDVCSSSNANVPVHAGQKRKKVEVNESSSMAVCTAPAPLAPTTADMAVDTVMSSSALPMPPVSVTNDLSDISFTPNNIFPVGSPMIRQESDEAFVDELFNALDTGDEMDISLPDPITSEIVPEMISSSSSSDAASEITALEDSNSKNSVNAPDPKLMDNLSDALTVLPKDIQELLVNRLITTITSSDALKAHLDSVVASSDVDCTNTSPSEIAPQSTTALPTTAAAATLCKTPSLENHPDVALPLAAATLTALMTQFSSAMKTKTCLSANKSLPVIPIHA